MPRVYKSRAPRSPPCSRGLRTLFCSAAEALRPCCARSRQGRSSGSRQSEALYRTLPFAISDHFVRDSGDAPRRPVRFLRAYGEQVTGNQEWGATRRLTKMNVRGEAPGTRNHDSMGSCIPAQESQQRRPPNALRRCCKSPRRPCYRSALTRQFWPCFSHGLRWHASRYSTLRSTRVRRAPKHP